MRRFSIAAAAVGLIGGLLSASPAVGAAPTKVWPLPNARLTPGATDARVTQENVGQTICVAGYTKTVRRVSTKTKAKVYAAYTLHASTRRVLLVCKDDAREARAARGRRR